MGLKIESNLPQDTLQDVMNLAQNNTDIMTKLAQWHKTELSTQIKKA